MMMRSRGAFGEDHFDYRCEQMGGGLALISDLYQDGVS